MQTIKSSKEFTEILRKGKSRVYDTLVVYYSRGETPDKAYGFTLPKRYGGSVERNLTRRRMKAALARHEEELPRGRYVLMARKRARRATYWEIEEDIKRFVKEVQVENDRQDDLQDDYRPG